MHHGYTTEKSMLLENAVDYPALRLPPSRIDDIKLDDSLTQLLLYPSVSDIDFLISARAG